ncbi:hypothetical protein KP509_37G037800 [Ceratopteris richardii]|uniref:Uncharacterized protein n=1 Tax=Ceratopteris richardii TaxID=49495 RepID=A0A8T2Q751_CERRI|nr:hypothetical protein KP509_37G037800 [Ceratopteris richardii]
MDRRGRSRYCGWEYLPHMLEVYYHRGGTRTEAITMVVESYGKVALKEAKRMWPFVMGFGVSMAILLKLHGSCRILFGN